MNFLNKKPLFFAVTAAVFLGILLIVFREFAFNPDTLMLNSDQLNGIGSRILRAENAILTEWDAWAVSPPWTLSLPTPTTR